MTRYWPTLALGGFALFLCGVALGQHSGVHKLEKYEQPAHLNEAQWRMFNASLETLRHSIPYDSYGIGAPILFFDMRTKKVRADAPVDSDTLEKQPTQRVKTALSTHARLTFGTAKAWVPDLSERDFEMDFYDVFRAAAFIENRNSKDRTAALFAEYRNGKLILPER